MKHVFFHLIFSIKGTEFLLFTQYSVTSHTNNFIHSLHKHTKREKFNHHGRRAWNCSDCKANGLQEEN